MEQKQTNFDAVANHRETDVAETGVEDRKADGASAPDGHEVSVPNRQTPIWNTRVNRAIRQAAVAHAAQKRKGSGVPYIVHPVSVAMIVADHGADENTVIAALMHDVLEDVSDVYSAAEMERDFGPEVVQTVRDVSEVKNADGTKKPWQERKEAYLAHLASLSDPRPLMVATADKIHNMQSILEDYARVGERVWERFNAGKERELWYYRTVVKLLAEKDEVPEAMREQMRELLAKLENIA